MYPLHAQAIRAIERWSRIDAKSIASCTSPRATDWDKHVALLSYRYKTKYYVAFSAPSKSMFESNDFEALSSLGGK